MIGITDDDLQPRRGRPRKWASNAERMRAYRAAQHDRDDTRAGRSDAAVLAERVAELTDERDRLWAQIVRLQQRIAELENALAGHPAPDTAPTTSTPTTAPPGGLSRAERRRDEREQQRRQRQR